MQRIYGYVLWMQRQSFHIINEIFDGIRQAYAKKLHAVEAFEWTVSRSS